MYVVIFDFSLSQIKALVCHSPYTPAGGAPTWSLTEQADWDTNRKLISIWEETTFQCVKILNFVWLFPIFSIRMDFRS